MTTVNDKGEMPLVNFSGRGFEVPMSDGRFIALTKGRWDDGRPGWLIKAGRGSSSISMGLSDEAMVNLFALFADLEAKPEGWELERGHD